MNFVWSISVLLALRMFCAEAADPQAATAHVVKGLRSAACGRRPAGGGIRTARAIELGSRDPHAYTLLGLICDRTNRLDESVRYYEEALRIDPGFTAARNDLGSAFIRQGRLDEASNLFEPALKAAPLDVTANFNVGVIRAQQGRFEEATQFLETCSSQQLPRMPWC